MYRSEQQLGTEEDDEKHLFVSRFLHLPLVATAMDQVNALYSSTKQSSRLIGRTMEMAETGVGAVLGTAAVPVNFIFDKPLTSLDHFACGQLDRLESKFPTITKPTEEVVKATKDMCNSAVQPIVDRVSSAKQFGYDKVSDVRCYTGERLGEMRDYGWTTYGSVVKRGNDQVTRALTAVSHLREFDILETADQYVDFYLPPLDDDDEDVTKEKDGEKEREETERKEEVRKEEERKEEEKVEEERKEEEKKEEEKEREEREKKDVDRKSSSSSFVVSKAFRLGSKVQRRLWSRSLNQMKRVQLRSRETLHQLNFTVDLIEFARTNLNETKNKMESIWMEVNKTDEEIKKEETNEEKITKEKRSGFERRAIATARHLTLGLKSTLSWLRIPQSLDTIPEAVRGQIRSVQTKTQSLVDIFNKEMVEGKDLTDAALNRARTLAAQIYSGVLQLVSNLTGYGGGKKKRSSPSEVELRPLPTG